MFRFKPPISALPMTSSPACTCIWARTAATAAASASSSSRNDHDSTPSLDFPKHKHPTPFEVFHFSESDTLSTAQVRKRYYELARLYHPDHNAASARSRKGKGKEKSTTEEEFKIINAAYELLRNPRTRDMYVRTGQGWAHAPDSTRRRRSAAQDQWDMRHSAYDFRRGRPMSYGWKGAGEKGWNYADAHAEGPFTSYAAYGGYHPTAASGSAGWKYQGVFASNGAVFLVLLTLTVFVTPLRLWSTLPPELDDDGRWVGAGSRHQDAVKNLETARREARTNSDQKREALKNQIRLIEARKAAERAAEVERIESGLQGTGHPALALPEPSARTESEQR